MKQIIVLPLALLLLTISSCTEKAEISAAAPLESYVDSLFQVSVDSAEIAGASVLVHQNGKTLIKKTYGYASIELSAHVHGNGVFEI